MPATWQVLFHSDSEDRLTSIESDLSGGMSEFAVNTKLRADGVPADEAATLLNQASLRSKARAKFGDTASRMFFTPAGLEQASRAEVAALHARRFSEAGVNCVADLGCGIGAESLALLTARVGVLAVEIDALTARLAEHNLKMSQMTGFKVLHADATTVSLGLADGVFLDPARRTTGHRDTRRLSNPDDYSPSLDFAFNLAARLPTGIKLGPGFDRELIPETAEAQWVSVNGQLVETGLWFGKLARPGIKRAALVLRSGVEHELTAPADAPDVGERPLGEYLYEPDGAVIRARLIGLLANQLNAAMISPGIAYLTSDHLVATPFAQAFKVTDQLPASQKQLGRALAERGIGTLEIKKRGADVDPAALRTRLRLKGPDAATLFLTRVAGKHVALLAERV